MSLGRAIGAADFERLANGTQPDLARQRRRDEGAVRTGVNQEGERAFSVDAHVRHGSDLALAMAHCHRNDRAAGGSALRAGAALAG
jgi:hypothetical protein